MGDPSSPSMEAARFHARHDIRIETVPRPTTSEGQILVDIAWCGVCGTDNNEFCAGPMVIRPKELPQALDGGHLPVTMGHEIPGTVTGAIPNNAVSAEGETLEVGDHVVVDPRLYCRQCPSCISGRNNICPKWGFLGLHSDGGFATTVAAAPRMCHKIPKEMSLAHAALIEPLTVGRHALAVSGVGMKGWKDRSVLVIGGGPVGFAVLANLHAARATNIFVSEPAEQRREQTRSWARQSFNPLLTNVSDACRNMTEGQGVDIVFDCAGKASGMMDGMQSLRPRGMYVNVAGWEKEFVLPLRITMARELTIKMSMAYDDQDFTDVVRDFVAGKFAGTEDMITGRIPLKDIVKDGFEQLVTNMDQHVKILVTPRSDLLGR